MNYNAYAKLGRIHDNIRRKCLNNSMKFISTPIECLRIKNKKNDEGDIISHTVEKADLCQIVFPPMKEIPVRYIENKDGSKDLSISSLVGMAEDGEEKKLFKINCTTALNVGDIICRYIWDDCTNEKIGVVILEITDIFGSFGATSLVMKSYNCAIYTQKLPQQLLQMLYDWAERRRKIGW